MTLRKHVRGAMLITMMCLGWTPVILRAQSGGGYSVKKSTIDAGGGKIAGGGYFLDVTLGQHDAIVVTGSGGYKLTGGFWSPTASGPIIPTVSEWGLAVFVLLLVAAGSVLVRRSDLRPQDQHLG